MQENNIYAPYKHTEAETNECIKNATDRLGHQISLEKLRISVLEGTKKILPKYDGKKFTKRFINDLSGLFPKYSFREESTFSNKSKYIHVYIRDIYDGFTVYIDTDENGIISSSENVDKCNRYIESSKESISTYQYDKKHIRQAAKDIYKFEETACKLFNKYTNITRGCFYVSWCAKIH